MHKSKLICSLIVTVLVGAALTFISGWNTAAPGTSFAVSGAPTGLSATAGNTTVALSWSAPSSNGGSAITGYNVYEGMSAGGESTTPVNTSLVTTTTTYMVTSLRNGILYYFTVKAVNAVGL